MPTEMGSACFLTGGFNHRTKLLKETLDSFLWLVFLGVVWFFFFFLFFQITTSYFTGKYASDLKKKKVIWSQCRSDWVKHIACSRQTARDSI